jgi:protein-tyrosine phosphatase
MEPFNFGPAAPGDKLVFGAERPGYPFEPVPPEEVETWLSFVHSQGVERVICLLEDSQLADYEQDLLDAYRQRFGDERVLSAPLAGNQVASRDSLVTILAFLDEAAAARSPTVVHCSAGSMRTGQVLASWLAYKYGLGPDQAIDALRAAGTERDPVPAGRAADLRSLIEWVRSLGVDQAGCRPR